MACYNVSALAIQVPITTLLKAGASATPANILDGESCDWCMGICQRDLPLQPLVPQQTYFFGGDW
ncbi:MAG: hypothetical protein IPN72_17395, partial [Saprospiraceae bacterium]|nr:hypothetical protein [Saprospiraceae bacterium]